MMKSSPSYNSTMMVNAMGSNNGSVKNASSFLIEPSSTSSPQLTTSQQAPKLIKFNAQELDAANKPSAMFQSGAKNLNNLFKIEKELSDLTLTIEKEMEKANDCYYGQCRKCNKPVYGRGNACQALNSIFHVECFGCTSCGRLLRGKPFYCLNNNSSQIYCEEDYLYSGFLENAQKCAHCQQLIVDKILQALGKSYHPNCFRCFSCNHSLDGLPFTLDIHSRVYCLNDYFRLYSPKCSACGLSITPVEGTNETVRVVALDKDYHVDCYACEDCGVQLTDEQDRRCYPIGQSLLCYSCHVKRVE